MSLHSEQIAEHLNKLKAEQYKKSYYLFFKDFWDTVINDPLIENWHINYLCAELQKVGEQIIEKRPKEYDLIINISPGESKSTIATVLFPAWLWTRAPHLRIISASYSATLSMEHSTLSKDCIMSDRYQRLFGDIVEMRDDADAKTFYKNTAMGYRKPVSTGSAVTGSHADLILIDDPISPKQASSKAFTDSANDFINKTLSSRKTDKLNTPTIMIMQRLNEDDPTGNWLAQMKAGRKIKHICLPATDDYPIQPNEARQFYTDGVMNPFRTAENVLREQKHILGSLDYAGQYGQQPAPLEGNIVKRSHLPIFDEAPDIKGGAVNFSIDTAYEIKKENDPSGILVYKMALGMMWVLHYESTRLEFPELIARIKQLTKKFGNNESKVYIEKKASGASVVQYLKRYSHLNVISVVPKGDKMSRLVSTTPRLEAHRVVLVKGAWNEEFIVSVTQFPNSKHDEEVDCLTQAVKIEFNSSNEIPDPETSTYKMF